MNAKANVSNMHTILQLCLEVEIFEYCYLFPTILQFINFFGYSKLCFVYNKMIEQNKNHIYYISNIKNELSNPDIFQKLNYLDFTCSPLVMQTLSKYTEDNLNININKNEFVEFKSLICSIYPLYIPKKGICTPVLLNKHLELQNLEVNYMLQDIASNENVWIVEIKKEINKIKNFNQNQIICKNFDIRISEIYLIFIKLLINYKNWKQVIWYQAIARTSYKCGYTNISQFFLYFAYKEEQLIIAMNSLD
jgi:hypothetical protein